MLVFLNLYLSLFFFIISNFISTTVCIFPNLFRWRVLGGWWRHIKLFEKSVQHSPPTSFPGSVTWSSLSNWKRQCADLLNVLNDWHIWRLSVFLPCDPFPTFMLPSSWRKWDASNSVSFLRHQVLFLLLFRIPFLFDMGRRKNPLEIVTGFSFWNVFYYLLLTRKTFWWFCSRVKFMSTPRKCI